MSRRAEREIRRLTPQYQVRVVRALDALAEFPKEGDLRKLRGSRDDWRIRVGDLIPIHLDYTVN